MKHEIEKYIKQYQLRIFIRIIVFIKRRFNLKIEKKQIFNLFSGNFFVYGK